MTNISFVYPGKFCSLYFLNNSKTHTSINPSSTSIRGIDPLFFTCIRPLCVV